LEFSLTFEQAALKDAVARFVADSHSFEVARSLAASSGFSSDHWNNFADFGWLALRVSENRGGLAASPIEAALIMEEFGRGLVAAPYVSTAVLAARLLDGAGGAQAAVDRLIAGEAVFSVAPLEGTVPAGEVLRARDAGNGYVLSGRVPLCLDGGVATDFILPARLDDTQGWCLFHVPASTAGLGRRTYRSIDQRSIADLQLDSVRIGPEGLLAGSTDASKRLGEAFDEARLALAAEALGLMEAAIDVTAAYLGQRRQFGRPLSSYQVLTHRVADMLVRKDHARSMLYRGLAHLCEIPSVREAAVSAAMVAIIERGEFICSQAIQLHGGIGMTEEHVVGHYYKRLRAIGRTWGDLNWHMDRFMARTGARAQVQPTHEEMVA